MKYPLIFYGNKGDIRKWFDYPSNICLAIGIVTNIAKVVTL